MQEFGGEKLCKAREESINLFNCFSEPQPILCKSDDLAGVFNSCCEGSEGQVH